MKSILISKLSLNGFKNLDGLTVEFNPRINCLFGPNGSGKTNLLDAIYFLSISKSYFNAYDSQCIQHDQPYFLLQGEWSVNDKIEQLTCSLKRGEKKVVKINKKEIERRADLIGKFPVVFSSPTDLELILGGSELRRKFFDHMISQSNKEYLNQLLMYHHALVQRNNLLKQSAEHEKFDRQALEAWDHQMKVPGEHIHLARKELTKEFVKDFNRFYQLLSDSDENVQMYYRSDLEQGDFLALMEAGLEKDRMLGYTTTGIHKDDWVFEIREHPVKRFASQGQQKSFLLALKLAQYKLIVKHLKVNPILMVDDVSDKLDPERLNRLLHLISGEDFGQVFITDTQSDRMKQYLSAEGDAVTYHSFPL